MKKLMLNIVAAVLTVFGLGGIAMMSPAYAGVPCPDGTTAASLDRCNTYSGIKMETDLMSKLKVVLNVILGIVGFVAVAMIILGGVSFITSQGDAAKVTKAKNTVLYGVVGLVVALLAFAIVNFILTSIFK